MADPFVVHRSSSRRAADVAPPAPDTGTALRVVLVVLAVFGALWLVYELGTLILLLVFSILFAYLVAPLVRFVQRRLAFGRRGKELPRAVAIAIAYLVVLGAVALFVSWVTPHVTDAVRQAPSYLPADSGQAFTVLQRWLRFPGASPSMVERAISAAASAVDAGARRMTTAFMHVATYLPWLVLIPILSFFLLKDAEALTDAAIRLLPRRWQQGAPALLDRVDTALAAYIRAQLLACTIVGVIVGVGFTLLRVPLAAVFGVAAGVAEFVPLLGPLVIAVVAAVVSALRHPMAAIWVLLFLGVLRVTEDYFIYPRLVGSSVHLHPLAVILAVLAGGELGGVVGVLLSVPILAAAAAVYECVGDARRATT